jgi:excisionase family DNA binding protein
MQMPSLSEAQAQLARATPLAERAFVRVHEAAVLSGLPVTKLQSLLAAGVVRSAKVGRSRLINTKSLIAVLEAAQVEPITLANGKPVKQRRGRRAA